MSAFALRISKADCPQTAPYPSFLPARRRQQLENSRERNSVNNGVAGSAPIRRKGTLLGAIWTVINAPNGGFKPNHV